MNQLFPYTSLPVVDVYGFIEGLALTNAFLDDIDSSTFVTSTNVASINATLNTMSTVLNQIKTALDTVNTNLTNIYARQLATEIASYVDVKLPVTGLDLTHAPVTLVGGLVVTAVGLANPLPVTVDNTVPVTLSAIDTAVATGTLVPVSLGSVGSTVPSGNSVPVHVNGPDPLPISGTVSISGTTSVSGTVVAQSNVYDIVGASWQPALGFAPPSLQGTTSGGSTSYIVASGAVPIGMPAGITYTGSGTQMLLDSASVTGVGGALGTTM